MGGTRDIHYHSLIKLKGQHCTYQTNEYIDISEDTSGAIIGIEDVRHFRKVQSISHVNLRGINEVPIKGEKAWVFYEKINPNNVPDLLLHLLGDDIFVCALDNNKFENDEFRAIISDIIDGLVELHSNQTYHGDLRLETMCLSLSRTLERPVIKLGGFKRRANATVLDMVMSDWQSVGQVLEDVVKKIREDFWDNELLLIELKDLCARLKSGNIGLEMKQTPAMMSNSFKNFVYGHPALLRTEDRPQYLLLAVAFLKVKENGYLWQQIRTEDVLMKGIFLVDPNLDNLLLKCKAITRSLAQEPINLLGAVFVLLIRNLCAHTAQNKGKQIEGIVGKTQKDIDGYFRSYQPKVLLALYDVLKNTKFNFDNR